MQFMAPKNVGYVVHVKDPEMQYLPDGRERLVRPALVADFADQSLGDDTYEGYDDPINGRSRPYTATRGGGYFDTEVGQKRHGWTDDERLIVEDHLTFLATTPPRGLEGDIKLYTKPVPVPPWPTYDGMHHNAIPEFAKNAGMVAEALRYELMTKNRPALVEKLSELRELEVGEDALTAA